MIKHKLELLGNVDNSFIFPQATIDSLKNEEDDTRKIKDILNLHMRKVEDHFMYPVISRAIENSFHNFDFVVMKDYPLPSAFNTHTKRIIVNLDVFDKKDLLNVHPQDIYATLCYAYASAYYSLRPIDHKIMPFLCDYMSAIFIKLFAKKYGLIGSYTEEIPRLRYLVTAYVLTSFFNLDKDQVHKTASSISASNGDVDFDNYDLNSVKEFIRCLSDSGIFHGISAYQFASVIIRSFGVSTLALFEDPMRFMSTICGTTANSNLYPIYFQKFNQKLYNTITQSIQTNLVG